jgi:tetratricopeptide (TPR) repeat protein
MSCAWRQTTYWRDSETLWNHALACTSRNALAHESLGATLTAPEEIDKAIAEYREALRINPAFAEAHYNLGVALARRGQVNAAIAEYRQALAYKPDFPDALCRLGNTLADRGENAEAIALFRKLLKVKPDYANVRYNLGVVLNEDGKTAEALVQWREALRSQPDDLGIADQLAWTLATSPDASIRNGPEAVALALRTIRLSDGTQPTLFGTLAAAYAEAGQFPKAIEAVEHAIALASAQGDNAGVDAFRGQLKLYRAGSPYRDSPTPPRR